MPLEARFPARWSASVLIITFAVLGLMAGIAIVTWQNSLPPTRWLATGIFAAIVLITLPFSVRGYGIAADRVWIERWGWRHAIARNDIVSLQADPEALRGAIRLWASGGLFGFFGLFWSRKLGRFRAYCTAPKNCIIVQLRTRTIVISPADPAGFIAALTPPPTTAS